MPRSLGGLPAIMLIWGLAMLVHRTALDPQLKVKTRVDFPMLSVFVHQLHRRDTEDSVLDGKLVLPTLAIEMV